MGMLNIERLAYPPHEPTPNTIYIIGSNSDSATLMVAGEDGLTSVVMEGVEITDITDIALDMLMDGVGTGDVTSNDMIPEAISKLQDAYSQFGSELTQPAIESAKVFTSVPTTEVSPYILVSTPHLRMMVWDGAKYIRAPWHQPGLVSYYYGNPASVPGKLPVRGDLVYQQANYPDLVAALGLSGTGIFSLVEARGEFIRVLDNGRGVDANRALRSVQGHSERRVTAQIVMHSAAWKSVISSVTGAFSSGLTVPDYADGGPIISYAPTRSNGSIYLDNISMIPSRLAPEIRPRNIATSLWVSY